MEYKAHEEKTDEEDKEMEELKIMLKEMYDICIRYNEMKSIITPDNEYVFSGFSISIETYNKLEKLINDIKRV